MTDVAQTYLIRLHEARARAKGREGAIAPNLQLRKIREFTVAIGFRALSGDRLPALAEQDGGLSCDINFS